MQLNEEQQAILLQIMGVPGAPEFIEQSIVAYLLEKFGEDIEADPTIDDPEAVMEILSRGVGHIHNMMAKAKALVEAATNG